jgi:hypothetical protein
VAPRLLKGAAMSPRADSSHDDLFDDLPRAAAIRVPALHCPFTAELHADADAIQARTVAWAVAMGLVPRAEAPRLDAAKIGRLAARANPRGPRELVDLAADWTTFFCLLDDRLERLESAHAVYRCLADLGAVLRGAPARHEIALERAAQDLHTRLFRAADPAWMLRFERRVGQLFEAFCIEAEHRVASTVPSLPAYLPMREVTVGIHVELALSELVAGIALSEEERARVAELNRAASNLVGWANDVYTFEKELRAGERNNLVAVLMVSEGASLRDAVRRAAEMHDELARAFAVATEDAARAGSVEMCGYVGILRAWVRGHLDWARETGRYAP